MGIFFGLILLFVTSFKLLKKYSTLFFYKMYLEWGINSTLYKKLFAQIINPNKWHSVFEQIFITNHSLK